MFENPLPPVCQYRRRVRRPSHAGQVGDIAESGHLAQTTVQQAGIDQHERSDFADVGFVGVVDSETAERSRQRLREVAFTEASTGERHGKPKIVCHEFACRPQARRGNDMRVDGSTRLVQVELELSGLFGAFSAVVRIACDSLRRRASDLTYLDEAGWSFGEASVMGLQRPQDLADRFVAAATRFECRGQVFTRWHRDRNHDVAEFLAFGATHDSADSLHDVNLTVARLHEHHGIQRGHVHAFGQQLRIADHASALVGTSSFELAQFLTALEGRRSSVKVSRLDLGGPFRFPASAPASGDEGS